MRISLAVPLLLTATVALSGCADFFGSLGFLGVSVSGQVRVPEAQLTAIGGLEGYRTSAYFPGEVSVGEHAELQSFMLAGLPVANSTTRSDASGNFRLGGVPSERVSVIRATVRGKNGKSLRLSGLVKASGDSTVMDLSAVSTLVAEGLLRAAGTGRMEGMSQAQITELEHVVRGAATLAGSAVDLSGAEGPAQRFEAIATADAEVRDLLAAIQAK